MVWKWKGREIEDVKKFQYWGIICEWESRRADKGESKKGRGGAEGEDKKEKICKGMDNENAAV